MNGARALPDCMTDGMAATTRITWANAAMMVP